jgi:glycosyltransferase involved in cell wall biosynthesis
MAKPVLACCSILKPVDDPRVIEKIAYSLKKGSKYDINIIGLHSKKISHMPGYVFHPVIYSKPGLVYRLLAIWKTGQKLIQLSPQVIIFNTPEIQWLIVLYKRIFGCYIIYDIQENWRLNNRARKHRPRLMRILYDVFIYGNEHLLHRWVDQVILAERVYENQLSFLRRPFVVLENKFNKDILVNHQVHKVEGPIKLVFSGTISTDFGVWDAIHIARKLVAQNIDVTLKIIGHCPERKLFDQLTQTADKEIFIELNISKEPIVHAQIIQSLLEADAGMIFYQNLPHLMGKRPSTVFELLALNKPFLVPRGSFILDAFNQPLQAIPINQHENAIKLDRNQINKHIDSNHDPSPYCWSETEAALISDIIEGAIL